MSPTRIFGQQGALLPLPRAVATRIQVDGEQMLIKPSAAGEPEILLGDLDASSVPEVITLINSGRRTGELVVQYDVARKSLTFVDGEIVAVSSNVEDDRVGEVMWRQGLISLDQLMAACAMQGPGKRLGRLLIDNGFIDTRQLYNGLRDQVREVFLSVFLFPRGTFVFAGQVSSALMPMRLEERTEKLIMDGVLQLDQVSQLYRLIGPLATEVIAVATTSKVALSEFETAMFQYLVSAQKALTVQNVLDGCRVGELKGLKSLAMLLKRGLVKRTAELVTPVPTQPAVDRVAVLVEALNLIASSLVEAGFGAVDDVHAYLAEMRIGDQPLLTAAQSGQPLDTASIRQRATALGIDIEPVLLLLEDALGFGMFQLRETLPRERAQELSMQVVKISAR